MSMRLSVEVTQNDIDEGVPQDPRACAVQHALARLFPEADRVLVSGGEATIQYMDYERVGELPEEAKRFVQQFDDCDPDAPRVQPISFDLELTLRKIV